MALSVPASEGGGAAVSRSGGAGTMSSSSPAAVTVLVLLTAVGGFDLGVLASGAFMATAGLTTIGQAIWLATSFAGLFVALAYGFAGHWRRGAGVGNGGGGDRGANGGGGGNGTDPDRPLLVIAILIVIVADVVLAAAVGYHAWAVYIGGSSMSASNALYSSIGALSTANPPQSNFPDVKLLLAIQEVVDFLYVTFVVSVILNRLR